MPLSPEQVKEIKRQILEQTKNLPVDKREEIIKQLEVMTPEQLELFVKEQLAIQKNQQSPGGQETPPDNQAIFRAIISGKLPSKKIAHSENAIAVLEIKPISKGHTIIIPKNAVTKVSNLPSSIFDFAKDISEKIILSLKAKNVEIYSELKFGEVIINLVPIYDKPLNMQSQRNETTEDELDNVVSLLNDLTKLPKKKTKPKIYKLKGRIP